MELRNVETFLMVVENNSFSKAADVLGYTQSTVTFHIKQLEEEFGVLLFERIGRRIALTDEGRRFYDHARGILRDVREAVEDMRPSDEPEGLLRLGSVNSLSTLQLPRLLLELHERYPKIDIYVESEAPPMLFEMLRHNELDLLFLLGGGPLPEDMVSVYERKVPRNFVVRKDHPLARKRKLTLADIAREDLVLTQRTVITLEKYFGAADLELSPYLVAGTSDLLLRTVAESDAVSFLPDFTSQSYVDDGILKRIYVEGLDDFYLIKIIYHKKKWVTPQMEAFISLLK